MTTAVRSVGGMPVVSGPPSVKSSFGSVRGGSTAVMSWFTVVTATSSAGSSATARSTSHASRAASPATQRIAASAASAAARTLLTNTALGWRIAQRCTRSPTDGRYAAMRSSSASPSSTR